MKYYNIYFKRNFWLLPITIGSITRTSIRIRKVDWFIYTREHKLGSSDLVTAWLQIRCMYGNETSMPYSFSCRGTVLPLSLPVIIEGLMEIVTVHNRGS